MKHHIRMLPGTGFLAVVFVSLVLTAAAQQPGPALPSAADQSMFSDGTFTALRVGATADQVAAITHPALRQAGEAILAGTFRGKERLRRCRAYEPVDQLGKRLKISGYSQFENPTGIFFQKDEDAVVVVQGLGARQANLRIRDFGPVEADQSYPLHDGWNIIRTKASGLAYVGYFTTDHPSAPDLAVSVLSGKVNGVFDTRTSAPGDWQPLLAGTCTDTLDILGERVQLIYPVKELRQYCKDGKRMADIYDGIIRDQHQIMGLEKYNLVPANHILGRAMWKGYMHADGFGAAFHHDTMKDLADPDAIPRNAWAIAHEFGHVNQTRPGMKWVSTTEVTNNIFSSWTNFRLNRGDMRLEHERIDGGDGDVIGGRFNAFLNACLAGEQWLCQRGPDKMQGYANGGDHFVKLVPLWQLQLYFAAGRGNPDFYADIFQKVRETDETTLSNGRLQLNFMRNACDAARMDLTGFFIQSGMLKPIDKDMDDYSRAQLTITGADCDELVKYASRYPQPDSPVIHYISANSVGAYRNRLAVAGATGQGITLHGATAKVDHAIWKNTAAFETYRGKDLVKIAMTGTGSINNTFTLVLLPEGSTRIEAVGWDGSRTLVHGSR